jgi:signal transduction histidine kinase
MVCVGEIELVPVVMIGRVSGLLVCLIAFTVPSRLAAQQERAQSILFLDQSDFRGPFYQDIFVAFRERVAANMPSHITLYEESIGLGRFGGAAYEHSLIRYLREKYRDRPIGVIVAIGPATLEAVQRWRAELWPGIPVVFGLVSESDFARLKLPPDVTGETARLTLADEVRVARAVVRGLDRVVLVGDDWGRQTVFGHWKEEIPSATAGLQVTELIGLPIAALERRVAALPDKSAIICSAIYSDGEGGTYPPDVLLGFIAKKANRPIVAGAETYLEAGAIGGFMLQPRAIGDDVANRALRIINGKAVSDDPATPSNVVKPIFNWRQMQRWNVSAADLPPGSEIRFRELSFWEQYRWPSVLVSLVVLIQAFLISILLQERRRRSDAELEARRRLSELAHVHRQAIAGELSSSIAHELNQPLGSILTNSETAELILSSPQPNLAELKEILADIRQDDLRASQIIAHMRSLLKHAPFELRDIDLNEVLRDAFSLMSAQAARSNVALDVKACPRPLTVRGDRIQLQQVVLNLIANGMDAVKAIPFGRMVVGGTECKNGRALISISDNGPGVPKEKLKDVFELFFTTKEQGLGVGLSIARTIVQAHNGQIWAEDLPEGGAVFRISLPLAVSVSPPEGGEELARDNP